MNEPSPSLTEPRAEPLTPTRALAAPGAAPAPLSPAMSGADWAQLTLLAVIWGCSFLFNALALREMPVLLIVTLRVALASLALWLVMGLARQKLPRGREVWIAFLVMGFVNNVVPFTLIVAGQRHIPAGVASILNAATPLVTVVLAHLLTRDERLTPAKFAGVIIGFAGVAVMIGADVMRAFHSDLVAQLCCLGATVAYALSAIYGRRFRRMGVTPMATATGSLLTASLILAPVMLIIDRPWELAMPSEGAIAAVLGLSLVSTAFAYVLYYRVLASAGATNVQLVTFLIPAFAIFLGILVLGERLEVQHLVGMALIGLGLAAIDGRIWRFFRQRRAGGAG